MSKKTWVLVAGLLSAGLAMAQSSSLAVGQVKVKPATAAEALAFAKGEAPQGLWCDNFGYTWNLASAGMDGRVIALRGEANICGAGAAAGTVTIARGLPLDVTGTVLPGCFCNEFHQVVATWDKASGTFVGTAFAFGGCEASGPTQLGRC
jgi:hypothetical protein